MSDWNYQYMMRRYGRYIPKRNNMLISVDDRSGNLSPHDPAEEAVRFMVFHLSALL
jgi:hypothetical protein